MHPLWNYQKLVRDNDLYQVVCLFLEPEFIWKQTVKIDFQLCLPKFAYSVVTQTKTYSGDKCAKLWLEGKTKEVKKEIVRAIR